MCVVSMVSDSFNERWKRENPNWFPDIKPYEPSSPGPAIWPPVKIEPPVNRQEFEALKREVELLKDLLKRAKAYDEANNEPDCELEEKIALLKAIAKAVGVDLDLDEVFGK